MSYQKKMFVSIHERNLQVFATEMYKTSNGLSTPIMKDKFPINRNPYNLRQNSQFSRPRINTVYHGTESISNLGQKIWDLLPSNLKEMSQINFKKPLNNGNRRMSLQIVQSVCAKCRFSGKNNLKEVVKLFKEISKCYLKSDISKFVNMHFCACVVF